jgi:hypothetical protein
MKRQEGRKGIIHVWSARMFCTQYLMNGAKQKLNLAE